MYVCMDSFAYPKNGNQELEGAGMGGSSFFSSITAPLPLPLPLPLPSAFFSSSTFFTAAFLSATFGLLVAENHPPSALTDFWKKLHTDYLSIIYVCMYVCMYAYMNVCKYVCMHALLNGHPSWSSRLCMYVCMYV